MGRKVHMPDTPSKPTTQPVRTTRLGINHLEPETRRAALKLAGGDVSRITVVSPHEVVVR